MKRKKIIKLLLLSLTSVGFHSMTPPITSALTYQNSVDVEFTLNPAISISLSDDNLVIDNLVPGSSNDSNIITVNVATNASSGYYVSATAGTKTGNTNLVSSTSNTVFTNLSSNAATLNDIPSDRWGYSYSKDNGTTWVSGDTTNTSTGYNGLPLDNDDSGATGVIILNTDSFSNTGSFKFKIGAKASPSQASGVYTNTVNFYAVANPEPTLGPVDCEPGNICYNVNSLTQTEGTMGMQSASDGSNVTLLASNFSKHGYGFAGWSDTYDYSGNLYGPQETITAPAGTTDNGLSLYAIWVKSEGSFQDPTKVAQVCGRLTAASSTTKTLNSVSALTDQRDGETYAIAKLADGNCWMIENLRLESTNSDNSTGVLAQGYGTSTTYGNFSGLANAESTGFASTYTVNSLYYSGIQEGTASIDIGTSNYPGYRMPRYNNLNTPANANDRPQNPTSNYFSSDNTTVGMYSYGNYYTWHAAMANTTYYSSPPAQDANGKTSETVNTSLCPTGWRLPYGRGTDNGTVAGGFYNLNYKINNNTNVTDSTASLKIRSFPNNFLYSGSFYTSSAGDRGSYGYYWSSTAGNNVDSYRLLLGSSYVTPGTYSSSEFTGYSIRCTVSAGT